MKRARKGYRTKEIERIVSLSNDDLFEEYSDILPGDDYDGGFTREGSITCAIASAELIRRLVSCGFLSSGFKE